MSQPNNPPVVPNVQPPSHTPGQIINGDFEQGQTSGWSEYNNRPVPRTLINQGDRLTPPVVPSSGQWLAALAVEEPQERSRLEQIVNIPENTSAYLNFDYLIISQEMCDVPYYDTFNVIISNPANNLTQNIGMWPICRSNLMFGWKSHYVDLSGFAGQTIVIGLEASTIDAGATIVCLDNISIDPTPRQ